MLSFNLSATYGRIASDETEWLWSTGGRRMIAKAIRRCRKAYGCAAGRAFHRALVAVRAIYHN